MDLCNFISPAGVEIVVTSPVPSALLKSKLVIMKVNCTKREKKEDVQKHWHMVQRHWDEVEWGDTKI